MKTFLNFLNEALLLNQGKNYNQICFICGGAGSGKGYVSKIILSNKRYYKDITSDRVIEGITRVRNSLLFFNNLKLFIELFEHYYNFIKINPEANLILNPPETINGGFYKNYIKTFFNNSSFDSIITFKEFVIEFIEWTVNDILKTKIFKDYNEFRLFLKTTLTTVEEKIKTASAHEQLLDLSNKQTISFLRLYDWIFKIHHKTIENLISSISSSQNKPNLLIEIIGSHSNIKNYKDRFMEVGYKPEDISMIWVVTPHRKALEFNASRPRSLSSDAVTDTHKSAAKNIAEIFKQEEERGLKENAALIDGEIWIVINPGQHPEITDKGLTKDQFKQMDSKNRREHKFEQAISYFKIKDVGQQIWSGISTETKEKIVTHINQVVPEPVL